MDNSQVNIQGCKMAEPKTPMQIHQEYMTALGKIRKHIIDQIYKTKLKMKQKALNKIAIENAMLLKGGPYFIYEGEWYPRKPEVGNERYRKLHHSLQSQVHDLVHEQDCDVVMQKHLLINYIGSMLQFAGHEDDLKAILPYPIHDALAGITMAIAPPKPEAEILAFRKTHKDGVDCLNELLVDRMLLGE